MNLNDYIASLESIRDQHPEAEDVEVTDEDNTPVGIPEYFPASGDEGAAVVVCSHA